MREEARHTVIIDVIEKTLPESSFGPPRQLASKAKVSTPSRPRIRKHADKRSSKFIKSKRGCNTFISQCITWQNEDTRGTAKQAQEVDSV